MSELTQPRQRCTFTSVFAKHLVDLYCNGKRKCNIVTEYDFADSHTDKRISQCLKFT